MKLTIREAAERYGIQYRTIARACERGRLPYTMERAVNSQGAKRQMRVVRSEDVEALWSVETPKAMTLRDVAIRTGIDVKQVYQDVSRGRLNTTYEKRYIYRSDGGVQVKDVRVVTEDALAEYLAYRAQSKVVAKKPRSNPKRMPKLNGPYSEGWQKGKVPEHLRDAMMSFLKAAEAEVDYRRRQRRKREVAM